VLVDLVEALPHREEPSEGELGDGGGRDTGRVRDHAVVGEIGAHEVVDPRTDRLHPAQVRRERADVGGQVERERGLGPRPDRAVLVGELVGRAGHVVAELPEIRLGDDLDVGEVVAQRCEERVVGVPGIGDDDRRHARTSFSTPGAWTGASVDVR